MKRTKMFQTYWMSQQVIGTPCISPVREIHLSNGHDKEVDNCRYFSGANSYTHLRGAVENVVRMF